MHAACDRRLTTTARSLAKPFAEASSRYWEYELQSRLLLIGNWRETSESLDRARRDVVCQLQVCSVAPWGLRFLLQIIQEASSRLYAYIDGQRLC
jgi:hypothetical protein